MRPFEKPPLAVEEQLQLLKERGLTIRDDERASALLEVVSLFRLSPYMRPFQHAGNPDHRFLEGATLADIVTLYRFDRELRNLVMDALERVEVAVRARIGNTMAIRYDDAHWYLQRTHFKCHFKYKRLLDELKQKLERERKHFAKEVDCIESSRAHESLKGQRIERRMRDNYFRYYGQTYDPPELPPSWAVLEELSLGMISRLYQDIACDVDRKQIAKRFNLPQKVLGSWLHTFTFVRNCCAHHARLWNRELAIPPKLPKSSDWHRLKTPPHQPHPKRRLFVVLLMLAHLMRHISPDSGWKERLEQLLEKYPSVPLAGMGFIENWNAHPVWTGRG